MQEFQGEHFYPEINSVMVILDHYHTSHQITRKVSVLAWHGFHREKKKKRKKGE